MSKDMLTPLASKSDSDLAKDYLKEEQKQRRQEIESLITRIESDQRNGLIFTGAIWAWLATNIDKLDKLSGRAGVLFLRRPSCGSSYIAGTLSKRPLAELQITRRIWKGFSNCPVTMGGNAG